MRDISDKKRLALNLIATTTAFGVQVCIQFFLSPYIVKTLGVEAQGFVQLAANFASYVSLITVALNSMSARFITIEIHKGDTHKSGQYYTSVFWGNLVLFGVLLLPLALLVVYLDRIINITPSLVGDVKLLFSFVFLNLFITNAISLWNNTFYIVDRLYLLSVGTLIASVLNAMIILVLFAIFPARVWFLAGASLFTAGFTISYAFWNKRRYLSELKVKQALFSFKRLREILASGILRSLQGTGEVLLSGLDLLICNLMIDANTMGILALSKTMPTMIQGINWQIALTFAPRLTIQFAKNDKEAILHEIRRASKICAIIGTIPVAGLIVFGKEFFSLWVPGQDASLLQTLSILGCFWMALVAGIQPIGNVFQATNKVKPQAISVIISGILNTAIVFFCLKYTNLGVLAIAGTSTIVSLIRNFFYTVPASARYLGFKWHTFMFGLWYSIFGTSFVVMIALFLKFALEPNSWLTLLIAGILTCVIGLLGNSYIILNKRERKSLIASTIEKVIKK